MKRLKIFFVGDVHGCFEELLLLLKKAKVSLTKDRVILLGDIINKGPNSLKVLKWLKTHDPLTHNTLKTPDHASTSPPVPQPHSKHPGAIALMGNHELKFINCLEQNLPLTESLSKLKQAMGKKLKSWLHYIKSWPLYIEEKDFIALHGGLLPKTKLSESKKEHLLNIRYWNKKDHCPSNDSTHTPWHALYKGKKTVIYAHWAKQGLKIKQNSIGLDTGCVYGGQLTGLWWPEKKIVQVPHQN